MCIYTMPLSNTLRKIPLQAFIQMACPPARALQLPKLRSDRRPICTSNAKRSKLRGPCTFKCGPDALILATDIPPKIAVLDPRPPKSLPPPCEFSISKIKVAIFLNSRPFIAAVSSSQHPLVANPQTRISPSSPWSSHTKDPHDLSKQSHRHIQ